MTNTANTGLTPGPCVELLLERLGQIQSLSTKVILFHNLVSRLHDYITSWRWKDCWKTNDAQKLPLALGRAEFLSFESLQRLQAILHWAWSEWRVESGEWRGVEMWSGAEWAQYSEWVSGERVSGQWVSGEWVSGEWVRGEWVGGEWVSGEWVSGEWVGFERVSGEWVGGECNEGALYLE